MTETVIVIIDFGRGVASLDNVVRVITYATLAAVNFAFWQLHPTKLIKNVNTLAMILFL